MSRLEAETVNVVQVRVYTGTLMVTAFCHFWRMAGQGTLEVFTVENGRMGRSGVYEGVTMVYEVSG